MSSMYISVLSYRVLRFWVQYVLQADVYFHYAALCGLNIQCLRNCILPSSDVFIKYLGYMDLSRHCTALSKLRMVVMLQWIATLVFTIVSIFVLHLTYCNVGLKYLQLAALFRSNVLNVFVFNTLCLYISDFSLQLCLDQMSWMSSCLIPCVFTYQTSACSSV